MKIKGQICSSKFLNSIKLKKNRKNLKTSQNLRKKMSEDLNVRMSTIVRTPLKLGVRTYATYASC